MKAFRDVKLKNGRVRIPPPLPRHFEPPKNSTLSILEMAVKLPLASIIRLTGCGPHAAPQIRREFVTFVKKHAQAHREWKHELDAWLDFRIEQMKAEREMYERWNQE